MKILITRVFPLIISGADTEAGVSASGPASDLEALIERLERVTSRLERLPQLRTRTPPTSPAHTPPPTPPPFDPEEQPIVDSMSVNGYQDLVQVSH